MQPWLGCVVEIPHYLSSSLIYPTVTPSLLADEVVFFVFVRQVSDSLTLL